MNDLPLAGRRIGFLLEHPVTVGADVQEQMAACRRLGAHVTACFLSGTPSEFPGHGSSADDLTGLNLPVEAISGHRIGAARRLRHLLRKRPLDTLVCDQYKAISTAALATFFPHAEAPAIVALLRGYHAVSSPSRRRFYRLFGRHIRAFITLSAAQQQQIRNLLTWFPPDRIHVVPVHLDLDRLAGAMLPANEARRQLCLPGSAVLFGCISRLHPSKRVMDLVEATRLLRERGVEFHLVIIGGGKQEDALRKRIAEADLDGTVRLTGRLESAHRYMPAFDAFILPSPCESFGRVFLEAHAAKTPIIAADGAAAPEVAGPAALLFQPTNAADLADRMLEFMAQGPEEQLNAGQIGEEYARRHFSQEALDRHLQKALEKKGLLAESRDPGAHR
ncbi:glycosyltransferase [Alkalilimnicola ehrlichii MLHE-1]|uniref:Glycosyl transferase, group 1 n=1 Tax=Alkalilimnicola ehrlichii (strain ATCC BAA-1101 / DSM 17681 / MLHE-1) TaxID=187272 RepID=Q0A4U9_ALKEH|nr:glycosyltransferase [Alkalilimnicola ehrlichii]ABI58138.1 glycosyl transferase, group 1 [Alkalilimnicola ehrlichii MLHE-1]